MSRQLQRRHEKFRTSILIIINCAPQFFLQSLSRTVGPLVWPEGPNQWKTKAGAKKSYFSYFSITKTIVLRFRTRWSPWICPWWLQSILPEIVSWCPLLSPTWSPASRWVTAPQHPSSCSGQAVCQQDSQGADVWRVWGPRHADGGDGCGGEREQGAHGQVWLVL